MSVHPLFAEILNQAGGVTVTRKTAAEQIKEHIEAIKELVAQEYSMKVGVDVHSHFNNKQAAERLVSDMAVALGVKAVALSADGSHWYSTQTSKWDSPAMTAFYKEEAE